MLQTITQAKLKEVLKYNPNTGIFINKKDSCAGGVMNKGYIHIKISGKKYLAHRLAFLYMTNNIPEFVDHINHDRRDNRWSNIRPATRDENSKNKTKCKNNTSGIMGVGWSKRSKKWQARINVDKKRIHLGYFKKFEDAVKVRMKAEIKYNYHDNHGDPHIN